MSLRSASKDGADLLDTRSSLVNAVGDTIIFKNNTAVLHHIVLGDETVVGDIQPGASGSAVVKTASGNFYCTIHSTMIGSINAAAPPMPPPCTTPGCGC